MGNEGGGEKKKARDFSRALTSAVIEGITTKSAHQGRLCVEGAMLQVGLVPMFCTA